MKLKKAVSVSKVEKEKMVHDLESALLKFKEKEKLEQNHCNTHASTFKYECVACGWIGSHDQKAKRDDGWCSTDVCPTCGGESFYRSETKAKP